MPSFEQNKKIVLTKSGNVCAFPDCNQELVIEKTEKDPHALVADIAHIKGKKLGSARHDPNMTLRERDDTDNLIALCKICHKRIDDQKNKYTVEKLQKMKSDHEKWVKNNLSKAVAYVGFPELDVVIKFLISSTSSESDIHIIHPKEKIKKNHISPEVENLIKMGMSRISLVKDYINESIDTELGERLKQSFISEYNKFKKEELRGDKIFYSLLEFASGYSRDDKQRAAGLTILSYYFDSCDIFEK